jgi:hypothetical protein
MPPKRVEAVMAQRQHRVEERCGGPGARLIYSNESRRIFNRKSVGSQKRRPYTVAIVFLISRRSNVHRHGLASRRPTSCTPLADGLAKTRSSAIRTQTQKHSLDLRDDKVKKDLQHETVIVYSGHGLAATCRRKRFPSPHTRGCLDVLENPKTGGGAHHEHALVAFLRRDGKPIA